MSLLWPSFVTLAPYLLLTLAVAAVLAMYVALKRELAAQAQRNRRVEAMLMRLQEAAPARVAAQKAAVPNEDCPRAEGGFYSSGLPRPGMNLHRRVQALRLLRRGEELGYIASALGVPRCEVELLVRIHQLTMAGGAPDNGAPVPSETPPAVTGG